MTHLNLPTAFSNSITVPIGIKKVPFKPKTQWSTTYISVQKKHPQIVSGQVVKAFDNTKICEISTPTIWTMDTTYPTISPEQSTEPDRMIYEFFYRKALHLHPLKLNAARIPRWKLLYKTSRTFWKHTYHTFVQLPTTQQPYTICTLKQANSTVTIKPATST